MNRRLGASGIVLGWMSIIIFCFSCKKDPTLPSLTTTTVTEITQTTAKSGGNVTDDGGASVTARGICWSTTTNPTSSDNSTGDGSGTGVFTSNLTGLSPNTSYYVRAYAVNSAGTAYGNEVTFTTHSIQLPAVITTAVSSITPTTAESGGNVTDDGGGTVSARGVCWSTVTNPTTADNTTSNGTGTGIYSSNLTGLLPGTIYYVRAYATNEAGTAYGNEVTFTTGVLLPSVITTAVSSITTTSAVTGGNVTDDGGTTVTTRGVCWSTSANPTIADNATNNGTGTGIFISSLTGLSPGTLYYVRAYAGNSAGISYGNQVSFFTRVQLPALTTNTVSSITATSAVSGGNITDDGGGTVTARGVCWSINDNPTITDNHTNEGSGMGDFISNLTGLSSNTTYFVRAYGTNSAGTNYGNQVSFTTVSGIADIIFNPGLTYGILTDIEGNTYKTIQIGTQKWMAENLKTTSYNDGTGIPLETGEVEWSFLDTDAYCWFDNDESTYKAVYGALYNWYAVNTGKLCPEGWHVPSDPEWTVLFDYMGGLVVAGGKLKETGTTHWSPPNTGATNESGFTALPAGCRHYHGLFSVTNQYGLWWSSTEYDVLNALYPLMSFNYGGVHRYQNFKTNGMSVRCVKD